MSKVPPPHCPWLTTKKWPFYMYFRGVSNIVYTLNIVYPMKEKSAYFNKHGKIEAQYFKKDDCKVKLKVKVKVKG